jgi:amino acid transporter
MANKQQTGRSTIANIIAIIGIVLLLVFSFLGHSYMSGGELGFDIVIAVAITSFTAFLLWFLIKAKGAENNIDKWKKAELAALVIYVVFAIPASLFGGIMHFFVDNDKKAEIKQYAKADLDIIDAMFIEYKNFESEALAITGTGLSNAKRAGQLCDESLNSFMQERSINTRESAAIYEQIQRNKLIGEGFELYYKSFRSAQNEIEDAVSNWSVMQIPSKAKQIEDLATSASKHLTELSNEAELPIIENLGSRFTITGYQAKNFSVDTNSFMFKKKLAEASGFSITALLVVLLIHFLILFNYIVAYRTDKIAVGRYSQDDGGRVL